LAQLLQNWAELQGKSRTRGPVLFLLLIHNPSTSSSSSAAMRRTFAFCSSSPHFAKVASNGPALKRAARPLITLSPAATGCMRPPLTCTASSSSSSSSSFLLAHLKSSAIRPSSSSGRRQLFTATSNRTAAKTTSTTPLLSSGGHRFGAATKTAIRSIRIEGFALHIFFLFQIFLFVFCIFLIFFGLIRLDFLFLI
jgi:hypothetical protein